MVELRSSQVLFDYVKRSEALAARFGLIADRKLDPLGAFSMGELFRALGRGMLRGRFDAVRPFLDTGKRMQGYAAEIEARKALLEALPPAPA